MSFAAGLGRITPTVSSRNVDSIHSMDLIARFSFVNITTTSKTLVANFMFMVLPAEIIVYLRVDTNHIPPLTFCFVLRLVFFNPHQLVMKDFGC